MNEQQMLQEGIENIRNTQDINRLEQVSTMVLMGLVIDKSHEQEYITLFQECQNQLRVLSIISGEEHPLLEVDVINQRDRVERTMMISMLISSMEHDLQREEQRMMFSMN